MLRAPEGVLQKVQCQGGSFWPLLRIATNGSRFSAHACLLSYYGAHPRQEQRLEGAFWEAASTSPMPPPAPERATAAKAADRRGWNRQFASACKAGRLVRSEVIEMLEVLPSKLVEIKILAHLGLRLPDGVGSPNKEALDG